MKKNLGSTDKMIRLFIAIIFITLYFTKMVSGTLAIVLLVISIILLLTSLINFCPLYLPFGINTCKKK